MRSSGCVVDLDIRCHGRAYEHWTCDAGVRLYCYQICTCDGYVQLSDGRKVEFSDHLLLNSFNRTILVKQERIDGPRNEAIATTRRMHEPSVLLRPAR